MKRIHIVASIVAALLAGFAATSGATDPAGEASVESRAETVAEPRTDRVSHPAMLAPRSGEENCQLCQMPVYVPPSRGSGVQRIGGATRGSGIRG
jgi:hypothetical protein